MPPWRPAGEPWQAAASSSRTSRCSWRCASPTPLHSRHASRWGCRRLRNCRLHEMCPSEVAQLAAAPGRRPSTLAVASALLGDAARCGPGRLRVAAAMRRTASASACWARISRRWRRAAASAMSAPAVRPVRGGLRAGRGVPCLGQSGALRCAPAVPPPLSHASPFAAQAQQDLSHRRAGAEGHRPRRRSRATSSRCSGRTAPARRPRSASSPRW